MVYHITMIKQQCFTIVFPVFSLFKCTNCIYVYKNEMKGYLKHLFKAQVCSVRWGFSPKPVTLKVLLPLKRNKVIDHNTEEFIVISVAETLQFYMNKQRSL